jgi:drug/metabolite transporter (DMT)-like permease
VLLGASVVAVRVAVREVPPLSLAVLRFGQGWLLLAVALLAFAPGQLRVARRRLPLLALLGAVFFAAFPVTFNTGLRFTEASRGALMLATMPIWSAVLGRVVGERLGRRQLAGVGLSVLGIGLAFAEPGWTGGGGAALAGDGLLLVTGLLGAVYGLLAKRALAVDAPATVTSYAMLFGTLLLLPAALVEGLVPALGRLDGRLLAVVAFLGVPGGAIAFLLWTWALSRPGWRSTSTSTRSSRPCSGCCCWPSGAAGCSCSASWPWSAGSCWSTGPPAGRGFRPVRLGRDHG